MKEDCIFCKIIKEELPSDKVYEDESSLVFLSIDPVNPGHTLVIPKEHYVNIFDTPSEVFSKIMETVRKIAPAVKESVKAGGVIIGINNGKYSGQAVFHLHVHIMPRFKDDGLKLFPSKKYQEGEAEELVKKIKSLL